MMLNWTILLFGLGLLTFSTPMHHHHHRLSLQESRSSESSDSMESAEMDQQVIPTSRAPGGDLIIRAPADFGQPNENGRSAVTVSLRDENTNVSVDVLTFIFNAEDEGSRSSAAGESSGFSDEGMQADEASVSQRYRSDIVGEENEMGFDPKVEADVPKSSDGLKEGRYQTADALNPSSTGDKNNPNSGIYLSKRQTIDLNSAEVDDLSNDIPADEAFVASLDAAKPNEESTRIAPVGEGKQASEHSEPFYSTDHRFSSNSEETGRLFESSKSNFTSASSLEDMKASNAHDSASDNQPTHHPEDRTVINSLDDPESHSEELSTTLTTVFQYLLGELIGLRSVPAPPKSQSLGVLMTSRKKSTLMDAKSKGTDPRSDLSSIDSHKNRRHSGPTLSSWVFQGVSSLSFSSEEQEDDDESLVTDATPISPVPSPEPMLNPLAAKKNPFSSAPVYVNDGWPAVDYSNSLNDFYDTYGLKAGYEEWEHNEDIDNSINSHNSEIPTDTNTHYETSDRDPAQENTPAYSWEETEAESLPKENPKKQDNSHNEDQPEFTPDSAASREDANSSSSETSRESAFQLPRATDASPTDAGAVLSNSQESTETTVGPDLEKGALIVSSSSEESAETTVDSNSHESQNQTDAPDWPERQSVHDSGVQPLALAQISVVQLSQNLQEQDKEESLIPVDLTPESSSEEELESLSSTDAPGLIFSSHPPTSRKEHVSPASISRGPQLLPHAADSSESNEEDGNASLNPTSLQAAHSGNSSSEDESTTDSLEISMESTPESTLSHESFLWQDITERPESVSVSDLLVSEEDLSSEISTPNPSTGLEITSQRGVTDANANDPKNSEESRESQEPSFSTLLPHVASSPSRAPHTHKSSEENMEMDYIATKRFHSNPMPIAASPTEKKVNSWAAFLQSLKAHMTNQRGEHGEQKVQRPGSNYGNRHHSGHYSSSKKGQKASSSEESK